MNCAILLLRAYRLTAFAALILSLAVAPASFAHNEHADDPLMNVPLAQWISEGPKAQIPWKVKISAGGLSYHQRLIGNVDVQVDGKDIVKRPHEGSLICLVRLTDEQGNAHQEHLELDLGNVKSETAGSIMDFSFDPYVLPGVYRVLVVLWHSKSGEHSLMEKSLQIGPLKKDPFPEAGSDLPRVEFTKENKSLDDIFQPDIQGRLHLRLATRQPVRVELLADMTPLGMQPSAYHHSLSLLLPLLKTLSQIELSNGSLDVAALDLSRLRVSFEQENLGALDWERLREVLTSADPGVVGVRELQSRTQQAAFFRSEVAKRLDARPRGPKDERGEPLRVLILISNWFAFGDGNDLSPMPAPADGKCLVFYLRFLAATDRAGRVFSTKGWRDDLEKILAPLKPRVYPVDSPLSVRLAIADILSRVSQASGSAATRP